MECRAYGICLDSQSRGYLGKDRKVSSAAGGNLSRMHKTQETAKESRLNFMYSHLRNRTLDSAVATVEYFGDRADYVMIENSACFRSDEFKKTGLYDWLLERSAPTIVMPHISKVSLNAWEAADTGWSGSTARGEPGVASDTSSDRRQGSSGEDH